MLTLLPYFENNEKPTSIDLTNTILSSESKFSVDSQQLPFQWQNLHYSPLTPRPYFELPVFGNEALLVSFLRSWLSVLVFVSLNVGLVSIGR